MDVFKDHINNTLFDVNHTVGCTGILQAFLNEMGLLREAQRFSYWPHDYRIQVHYRRHPFTNADFGLPMLKVVRSPFTRAVSSYFSAVENGKNNGCDRGMTFRQFVAHLKVNMNQISDYHIEPQFKEMEIHFPNMIVCKIEDGIQASLDTLNERAGTSYSLEGTPRQEHHRTIEDEGISDPAMDRPFWARPTYRPRYSLFYDGQLVSDVGQIYAVDFDRYGYEQDIKDATYV